jgi:hypothetical protein
MTRFAALLALGFLSDAALSKFTTSAIIQDVKRATPETTLGPMPTGLNLENICVEGNDERMGYNYSPPRWCWCAVWGPFATISGATTDYCKFTATITLKDDSRLPTTTQDSACHVKTYVTCLSFYSQLDYNGAIDTSVDKLLLGKAQ